MNSVAHCPTTCTNVAYQETMLVKPAPCSAAALTIVVVLVCVLCTTKVVCKSIFRLSYERVFSFTTLTYKTQIPFTRNSELEQDILPDTLEEPEGASWPSEKSNVCSGGPTSYTTTSCLTIHCDNR